MDDHRSLPEWQALNRIWKAVPAAERERVKDDFKLITDRIKALAAPKAPEEPAPAQPTAPEREEGHSYLSALSAQDRKYAVSLIMGRKIDICAHIASLASSGASEEEIFDSCVAEFDIEEDDADKIQRIIAAVMKAVG